MNCARARGLFGAYWDDETTQGEREWLESHLNTCIGCRREYDAYARALEMVAALPREEVAPDFEERTVASAHRAAPASDRLPESERRWIPVTAVAAAAVLLVTLVAPWTGWLQGRSPSRIVAQRDAGSLSEPIAVARPVVEHEPGATRDARDAFVTIDGDSLFDHSEDVEFILDPVALRRGRAHPLPAARAPDGVEVDRTVISF